MWSAGRLDEALADYETCLKIRPQNPKVIFNMAMIYRAKSQNDRAIELFTQVVTQYADSEFTERARAQLTELVPQNQQAAVPGQSILDQGQTGGVAPSEGAAEDGGQNAAAETQAAGSEAAE